MYSFAKNSNILKAFNKHLSEFIVDLIIIFPEDKELKTFQTYFGMLKKVNPKSILVGWKYYVTKKYKQEIYSGNINYFLQKNYQDDLGDIPTDMEYYMDIIERLREPLSQLSDTNKKKATKYLQNLTKLSELY